MLKTRLSQKYFKGTRPSEPNHVQTKSHLVQAQLG